MKNKLIFILAISLCISISDARQLNPFLEENKPALTEEQIRQKNVLESYDYKKFTQNFDKRIHISIDEQKDIIKNKELRQLKSVGDWEAYLKLNIKEQLVLYDYYLIKNSAIPNNYFETMFSEKEYKAKEKEIWKKFQELTFPVDRNKCLDQSFLFYNQAIAIPSYKRLPKYRDQLLTLLSILYVVKDNFYIYQSPKKISNPFEFYDQASIKYGYFPILVCSNEKIDIHYGNFLNKYTYENNELEEKYREIFLLMMEEEMLKDSKYIFVPLSIVREHAEQSELSDYILRGIQKSGNKLTHHELAIQYYGGIDNWMTEIFNFIEENFIYRR